MSLVAAIPELSQRIKCCLKPASDDQLARLIRTCQLSPWFFSLFDTHAELICNLAESGDLDQPYDDRNWEKIYQLLHSEETSESIEPELRSVRKREMARIIYRDLNRLADFQQTTADLSRLADLCIQIAHDHYYQEMCNAMGTPRGHDGNSSQKMAVLALGKLGAYELNLSSDVDLIFFYDESGWVDGNENGLSNQEFFLQLSRKIIKCLSDVTPDGYVFRVDMRLRPYGESSALILNRNAMEQYYLTQGRDWERYAFIKARAMAGDRELGNDFLVWLKPFVFRKHLDYGAIESLRDMKHMINLEVKNRKLHNDLKLGPGGIREIEFIVQANQLICGGKDPLLQQSSLLHNLDVLSHQGYLPESDRDVLAEAYIFLRNSEHALQAEMDKQTHALPAGDLSRQRLALAMGFEEWLDYEKCLDGHRHRVKECFRRIIDAGESESAELLETHLHWQLIWRECTERESLETLLENTAFRNHEAFRVTLSELKTESENTDYSAEGKERLDRLVPILLGFISEQHNADEVLYRVLPILHAIVRRSTYILFLIENLDALQRMIFLCGMSHWLADQLRDYPVLLYELTDKNIHETRFDREMMADDLDKAMGQVEQTDLETLMDVMRQYKRSWVLKVAIFELLDSLPLMKASDALTWVAEIIVEKALEVAWWHLAEKHGSPAGTHQHAVNGFGVLAYGKLGGLELGYKSDLDLVFVHDHDIHQETLGPQPVNISTFFVRLAQRMVHILTAHTRFGLLYDIDLRLRPSGNKGPLVATLGAFERYQASSAWTWEHQALVRARFIAGDPRLGTRLDDIRVRVLSQKRNSGKLQKEVVGMREKMRLHLSPKSEGGPEKLEDGEEILVSGFDLKHGLGAIVDIEFMVQYAVLAWSWKYPELTIWTDKMRILDELNKLDLFISKEAMLLQKAYLAYRSAVHYQSLGGEVVHFEELEAMREKVADIWQAKMESGDAGMET